MPDLCEKRVDGRVYIAVLEGGGCLMSFRRCRMYSVTPPPPPSGRDYKDTHCKKYGGSV